ncbi:hypothetical protein FA566_01945 [Pseudomonas aeruginosa]|nr:hypothetical protein [Pseudomonas aeruginosa]
MEVRGDGWTWQRPPSCAEPHGKRSAQARSWKPGRRRQPSGARERWKPTRGETRVARLDAEHESAARQGRETPNWAIVFKVVEVPIWCRSGEMPNRFPG